ncbi:MAG TPA: hypothetical protein VG015_07750 [Candidatus Dormibacteraeota bacterium]|jgi:hypothetical protein|nr:hypothetical protein [Candidatus Dormibacteraeota bacterium]
MSIIEFIRDRARYYNCPVCGKGLKGCEVRMLKHVNDRFTVQVMCPACQVTFIMILVMQGTALEMTPELQLEIEIEADDLQLRHSGMGMEEAEAETEEAWREPIEPDEVLDLHLLLKNFTGPLTDLVKQRERL